MENENPSSVSSLTTPKMVSCQVIIQDDGYDILFDDRWMASVAHMEDCSRI